MAQTTLPGTRLPLDVESFCISHGILPDLHLAPRRTAIQAVIAKWRRENGYP